MTTLALLALAIWLYLVLAHGQFWQSGPELVADAPAVAPAVTIVVPARDEAETLPRVLPSLLAQDYAGPFSVVLVDDNSSDGTGALARAIADPRLTVLTGKPRPAGWAGKPWAMAQGAALAGTELILFTDADIVHAPGHLATLVAQAERSGAELVSEMVALNCESRAERALVPAFVYFFQLLYPFAQVNDPLCATAAAAGGTMLIRRATLARIGGVAAIADALIDDVALARAVKRSGRIWLVHTRLARSIRRYPGAGDIWRMIARSAYVQLRHSPALLVATILGMALVWLLPPAAALFGHGWAAALGGLAWALAAWSFLPTLARFGAAPLWAPFLPLIALFYMAATLGAARDYHTGRGAVWKSRAYGDQA